MQLRTGTRRSRGQLKGAIVMTSPIQDYFIRADRPPAGPAMTAADLLERLKAENVGDESDRNTHNVIAETPGTDPALGSEVVMAGAHVDSWHSATGATDNADGVATVMEAPRILKALGGRDAPSGSPCGPARNRPRARR